MTPTPTLTAEKEAQAQELFRVLQGAASEDLLNIARLLVAPPNGSPFGETEFQLRELVLRLGAKALQQSLAEKKTATREPA